jgi:hypothetical protein
MQSKFLIGKLQIKEKSVIGGRGAKEKVKFALSRPDTREVAAFLNQIRTLHTAGVAYLLYWSLNREQ